MIKNILLAICSITAIVLVIELLLHLLYFIDLFPDYPAMMTRLEKFEDARPISPVLFNDNVPHNGRGFRTFIKRGIPKQLIEFSEDGRRLDEFDGPARCTIGVFGDSMVEARQVGQYEDFSSLTESALRQAGYDVNFQNFGRGGYGTTAEYLRYKQLIEQGYKFDEVYLFFYPGNDIANNKRELNHGESGPYPYFVVEDGLLKRDDSAGTVSKTSRLWFLREFLAEYSHLGNLVMQTELELFTYPRMLAAARGAFDPNPDQEWQDAWLVTEKVVETWAHDATRRDSPFILVMLGTAAQLTGRIGEAEGLNESYPNERLQNFTADRNIEYLDMLAIAKQLLREKKLDEPSLFWRHDGHYSQIGHRLVSDALVEYFHGNKHQCLDGTEAP